jgi:hypothetical protein
MTIPITMPGALDRARTPTTAIVRRLAAISALALTVLAVGVPAASAGESEAIRTKGGIVTFKDRGDEITAEDTRRDGKGVQAVLAWNDATGTNHTVFVVDATGADVLSKFKDLSIREGTRVALTMCYVGDGGPERCSRPQRAVA